MNVELPCGCVVSEDGAEYVNNPPLRVDPCDDHDKGYLYIGDRLYSVEY